ncbi:aldehyde dehydrogenase family protein [Superficieibacter sp. HKU1]|uniref:aldehyde dehydrogenase family protein n=1 Tax=Superficieibacter sp. HKU1 TaxID=3031919 RepID=UPI0023E34D72|nr:aldehyde dehydrogenase family protein [Superficieibacter sp. HKU1]WES69911.1 aldehyde dehydrogenase family protein [Superficieibacter sp. HKU1]
MNKTLTVEGIVTRSKVAQQQFAFATQEQADAAARAICKVVYDNAETLGALAVEETRMGSVSDKIAKCRMKPALIWQSLKNKKSVGVIARIEERRMIEIARPMGVVASIIPATNPVVTPMSNAAFALKTCNSIIFAPHPRAANCTKRLVTLFRAELSRLGFPQDLVLGLDNVSVEESAALMRAVDIIVATGGMNMVKAAYSSGKPAWGVGAGNVQCIIDSDADLADAAAKIVQGRSFDNGLICLSEQTVFVPEAQFDAFISEIEKQGGYYFNEAEQVQKVRDGIFPQGGAISRDVVGLDARQVAGKIGLTVPDNTRVIVVQARAVGHGDVLCREKICPVLTVMPYRSFKEGVAMMIANLECEGKGHSIAIHSATPEHVEYAALHCAVSRVIVNQPAGTTGGGSPLNGFTPTTTLGCGSWGNNSFSGNFSYEHLLNITRIGYPHEEPWLADPELAWL